tara:strand:- start:28 stop:1278 length:1251 start_codon:yes stop_codon:yes gene_type:complete
MSRLHFISTSPLYKDVLEYIYILGEENIHDFFYIDEIKFKNYRYRLNNENDEKGKILIPGEIAINIMYNNEIIHCKHECIVDDKQNIQKLMLVNECCGGPKGEILFCKITLTNNNKEILTSFVDEARKISSDRRKKNKKKSSDTVRIYYYKDYWYLFSKIPKRPIDTLYLKEDELEHVVNTIAEFFSEDEREEYLSFGIPYKKVMFLYGVPGSGKTSCINVIASHFDCDIHLIPLSTDMDDSNLVEAFSTINTDNENNTNKKIILIEDIDCIFEDRKEGDHLKNKVTLQGLLNCMDGFTCMEGALIFITANKPESLDDAVIRSCRVDYKLELGYADKYQTEQMFQRFLPNQLYNFEGFYKSICHKKYTTAMLQELLFFNRKTFNIMDHLEEFNKIIEKNKPKKLLEDKNEDNGFYS